MRFPTEPSIRMRPLSRKKKALFAACAVVLVLLLAEGAAWCGLLFAGAEARSPASLQERRSALLARLDEETGTDAEVAPVPLEDALADQARRKVIHPFLGSVLDPGTAGPIAPGERRLTVSEQGFYRFDGPSPDPDAPVVAIFGGSVATSFAAEAPIHLGPALAPAFGGREPAFVVRALGAFKQPQQLLALAYFLGLGERYDAVVNLDGFNDLVLPALHNAPRGAFPFYPRDWAAQVGKIGDFASRRAVGEIAFLEERRSARARFFSTRPLRWLATANLLWEVLDRRLETRIAELQEDLITAPTEGTFRSHGPQRGYPDDNAMYGDLAAFWARASLQMHRLCEANGIRYYHFLQPNQYVPGSKVLAPGEVAARVTARPRYRRVMTEGWPHLRREGARLAADGVRFTDLTGIFESVAEPVYIDNCCHVNSRGNEILARAVARVVVDDLTKDR